ncbi:hypothetical protein Tsubulata_032554 [Turnera subulata]|uniref:Zinc knuckle CX2CX4HX4C domain-containing protein n=1 Tax=Turnera subulata TaxID=218843 RepID=A0A9Q0FTM6_9ROSI|nr:hypothetical protein Tsubulata_032554 [Turnera subulata]
MEQDYQRVLYDGPWIARRVGKPIKVDEATLHSTHVKYARVYVEVDLTKPLVSKFRLRRRIWRIVYEGLSTVCFMCGHCGHTLDACRVNPDPSSEMSVGNHPQPMKAGGQSDDVIEMRPELESNHGLWMLASERRRGKPKKAGGEASSSGSEPCSIVAGSHFAVLNSSIAADESPMVSPSLTTSPTVVRLVVNTKLVANT